MLSPGTLLPDCIMSNIPFKINHAGLFINPLIDTPDFRKPIQYTDNLSVEPCSTMETSYAQVHVDASRPLSFVPEGKIYNVYDGKVQHPRSVFLNGNHVEFPNVEKTRENTPVVSHLPNEHDKTLMKYYVAGVSIVGVLILARLLRK